MKILTEDNVIVTVGDRAFNYYEMKVGQIISEPEWNGWFKFHQDDGSETELNGERICSLDFANKKGWIKDES